MYISMGKWHVRLFYRAILQKRPINVRSLLIVATSCVSYRLCDMTHSRVWHDSFACMTWLTHMCDMTHSHVWHGSFICATRPMYVCDMTHSYVTWLIHMWHVSLLYVTWLTHMCDMTHVSVRHDSFMCDMTHSCVTWLLHMHNFTHLCVRHDSFLCAVWIFCVCAMSHLHVRHDSITLIHMNEWCHACECVITHMQCDGMHAWEWLSHVAHVNE